MKLLHLSDLHIGKRVYEFSMLEDQRYILDEILGIVDQERPDGVLLAGDIYDKTVPSGEAVQVLDGFLTSLADRGIPVFLISGNHDSPERIAFGAEIMSGRRVYVSPVYDGTGRSIVMEDQYGPVTIWLLPFLKPAAVRHVFPDQEIGTYEEAVRTAVDHLDVDTGMRNVLVAHQFVTGAVRCESEEVSVGGLDQVGVSVFAPFDYVALGHIHKPAVLLENRMAYPGSPEPLDLTETGPHGYLTGEIDDATGHVTSLKFKAAAQAQYIPLVVSVTPATTNAELSQLIADEIKKRGASNIYRFRIRGMRDPDTEFDPELLAGQWNISEILDETEPQYDFHALFADHPSDMIGFYIQALMKENMSPVEKKALYYGIHALLMTKDERS